MITGLNGTEYETKPVQDTRTDFLCTGCVAEIDVQLCGKLPSCTHDYDNGVGDGVIWVKVLK